LFGGVFRLVGHFLFGHFATIRKCGLGDFEDQGLGFLLGFLWPKMWGGELIGRCINEAIGIPFIYEL
jgi:hypothetical protein